MDGPNILDAVEECKQHLERLGVARSDQKVDVVLARWLELGAQIEGPGLGVRLEPVELVIEGREARDQDTLPRPGRFPDSQGREAGKPLTNR